MQIKNLIIQGVKESFEQMERTTPTTKGKRHFVSVLGATYSELLEIIEKNNIPKEATLEGEQNSYDAYDSFGFEWYTPIPNTQADRDKYQKEWFNRNFGNKVGYILKDNGFKRLPYDSRVMKKFESFCKLTEYKNNNFDLFVEYFSLLWVKDN